MIQLRSSPAYSRPFVNSHRPPHARHSAVPGVPRYIRGHQQLPSLIDAPSPFHFAASALASPTHKTSTIFQDVTEGARVGELSALFHQRCEVLTFYAMHNLSPPPAPINFRWSCPLLKILSLCTSPPHLDCLTLARHAFAYVYETPSWLWNTDRQKPGSFGISRLQLFRILSVLNKFRQPPH